MEIFEHFYKKVPGKVQIQRKMEYLGRMDLWSKTWVRGLVLGIVLALFYHEFIHSYRDASGMVIVPIEQIMTGNPIELDQDDPKIIEFIKRYGYLQEPSGKPYNLRFPGKDPSKGQGQMIRRILKQKRDGFFVECGALDGETRSNSLYLEKVLGWKGLLVEADPSNYQLVLRKNRKAWTSNSCLATRSYPHEVMFRNNFNIGKIDRHSTNSSDITNEVIRPEQEQTINGTGKGALVRVQCFPIYSLLAAMEVKTVDYFSLDVEGNEMDVLRAIPFDKLFIKTLSVEFNHSPGGKETLRQFMMQKVNIVAGELTYVNNLANDLIFVHSSLNLFPSTRPQSA